MKHGALVGLTFVSWLVLGAPDPAHACGGCFVPPQLTAESVVTGHRMVFAVSEDRTVLWDQFEYTGSPEEFSWVLPVAPGAVLEVSTDAWFESLEAATNTSVAAPQLRCATNTGDGCGCALGGSSSDSGRSGSAAFDDGVTVLHHGTVGPYETHTVSSDSGNELTAWLETNGYVIQPDIQPIIDAYVSEGADFIALKLQPGQGVQQMTPVRVITPHGDPILPLRMVAAGTGAFVDIVLFVIGEGRYELPDLFEAWIDPAELSFDFNTNESNYLELREAALNEMEGFAYLPTYAQPDAFRRTAEDANGLPVTFAVGDDFNSVDSLYLLYFAQARDNDGLSATVSDSSCGRVATALGSADRVVDGEPAAGEIAKADLSCGGYDDIATAMVGMRPGSVWLTRLELSLPREALSMDCVVEPASEDEPVDNQLRAARVENPPCPQPLFESRVARSGVSSRGVTLLAGAAAGALAIARRMRRKRRRKRRR